MIRKKGDIQQDQISPGFRARLERLKPREKVRVIVLLHTTETGQATGRRPSREKRRQVIEGIRKSAEPALADIDSILKRLGGKRLATAPDALGSIPVETTAAGINALAASEHVRAILEDQAIEHVKES